MGSKSAVGRSQPHCCCAFDVQRSSVVPVFKFSRRFLDQSANCVPRTLFSHDSRLWCSLFESKIVASGELTHVRMSYHSHLPQHEAASEDNLGRRSLKCFQTIGTGISQIVPFLGCSSVTSINSSTTNRRNVKRDHAPVRIPA